MVARISFPKRLLAALNYNENKLKKGNAECIAAVNYLKEAKDMKFNQKHSILEMRNELNERATTKTIHISLNFDPSENLTNEKLSNIASQYMEGIGFGEQPFLVYKHLDAGHPHVHIVSTTIKDDGSRINTHNLGRNQSEKARKEIEEKFGLVKAERQQKVSRGIKAIDAAKIIYGKSELKRSVSNVVSHVFSSYRFSSLPEYNAALRQFNVVADRGKEDGTIYRHRGLMYHVLDEKGNKAGVPIKASSMACKPTLDNLEKKFVEKVVGEAALKHQQRLVANAIDEVIKSVNNIDQLISALKEKNIFTLLRQNSEGRVYGITFVDNTNRVVFNGSDLGKGYSAASLLKRLSAESPSEDPMQTVAKNAMKREEREEKKHGAPSAPLVSIATNESTETISREPEFKIIEEITSAEANYQQVPFQLRRKRKKKKQNSINSHL